VVFVAPIRVIDVAADVEASKDQPPSGSCSHHEDRDAMHRRIRAG
jgi:hypothetical protein